jgi:UDP-glucose 6-dehydrogenase
MAELGHDVLAIDVDPAKVTKAASGEPPFFEPGLGFRACVLRERVQTEAEAV